MDNRSLHSNAMPVTSVWYDPMNLANAECVKVRPFRTPWSLYGRGVYRRPYQFPYQVPSYLMRQWFTSSPVGRPRFEYIRSPYAIDR